MAKHSVHSLIVSPNILNGFVCDFEREINSKRQKSKIQSIADLIIVLYKRNVVDRNNYSTILHNVLNYFPSISDKVKIEDFINSLDRQIDCSHTNNNQYGEYELVAREQSQEIILIGFTLVELQLRKGFAKRNQVVVHSRLHLLQVSYPIRMRKGFKYTK